MDRIDASKLSLEAHGQRHGRDSDQASRNKYLFKRADAGMVDSALESRVMSALAKNPYLPGRQLEFEMLPDKVVLRGIVGSYYQKQMAQETLRSIEGVHQIENLLQVHWT
jgi:osmotically-inducible protein OsmY